MQSYNTTLDLALDLDLDSQFAEDVHQGLTSSPKSLPHKYFYNAEGSRIFQKIMGIEDYYLTKCEYEILDTHKAAILSALPSHFDLVDLGAGDGLKTKLLLRYFSDKGIDFSYMPIDISLDILNVLQESLSTEIPELTVQILHDEYFTALKTISNLTRSKIVIFLGGNIGNLTIPQAEVFLKQVRNSLNKGDFFMLGFDLVKNPATVSRAYANSGYREFNHNLLKRINDDLGGNFDIPNFIHHSNYNPQTGDRSCFLVSNKAQKVWIDALQLEVDFEAWESIHTQISQKYSIREIGKMAERAGFKIKNNFKDSKEYFVDSLWERV